MVYPAVNLGVNPGADLADQKSSPDGVLAYAVSPTVLGQIRFILVMLVWISALVTRGKEIEL